MEINTRKKIVSQVTPLIQKKYGLISPHTNFYQSSYQNFSFSTSSGDKKDSMFDKT